jgi:hypothetical protein
MGYPSPHFWLIFFWEILSLTQKFGFESQKWDTQVPIFGLFFFGKF